MKRFSLIPQLAAICLLTALTALEAPERYNSRSGEPVGAVEATIEVWSSGRSSDPASPTSLNVGPRSSVRQRTLADGNRARSGLRLPSNHTLSGGLSDLRLGRSSPSRESLHSTYTPRAASSALLRQESPGRDDSATLNEQLRAGLEAPPELMLPFDHRAFLVFEKGVIELNLREEESRELKSGKITAGGKVLYLTTGQGRMVFLDRGWLEQAQSQGGPKSLGPLLVRKLAQSKAATDRIDRESFGTRGYRLGGTALHPESGDEVFFLTPAAVDRLLGLKNRLSVDAIRREATILKMKQYDQHGLIFAVTHGSAGPTLSVEVRVNRGLVIPGEKLTLYDRDRITVTLKPKAPAPEGPGSLAPRAGLEGIGNIWRPVDPESVDDHALKEAFILLKEWVQKPQGVQPSSLARKLAERTGHSGEDALRWTQAVQFQTEKIAQMTGGLGLDLDGVGDTDSRQGRFWNALVKLRWILEKGVMAPEEADAFLRGWSRLPLREFTIAESDPRLGDTIYAKGTSDRFMDIFSESGQVYFYGSFLEGFPRADSDLDFLVRLSGQMPTIPKNSWVVAEFSVNRWGDGRVRLLPVQEAWLQEHLRNPRLILSGSQIVRFEGGKWRLNGGYLADLYGQIQGEKNRIRQDAESKGASLTELEIARQAAEFVQFQIEFASSPEMSPVQGPSGTGSPRAGPSADSLRTGLEAQKPALPFGQAVYRGRESVPGTKVPGSATPQAGLEGSVEKALGEAVEATRRELKDLLAASRMWLYEDHWQGELPYQRWVQGGGGDWLFHAHVNGEFGNGALFRISPVQGGDSGQSYAVTGLFIEQRDDPTMTVYFPADVLLNRLDAEDYQRLLDVATEHYRTSEDLRKGLQAAKRRIARGKKVSRLYRLAEPDFSIPAYIQYDPWPAPLAVRSEGTTPYVFSNHASTGALIFRRTDMPALSEVLERNGLPARIVWASMSSETKFQPGDLLRHPSWNHPGYYRVQNVLDDPEGSVLSLVDLTQPERSVEPIQEADIRMGSVPSAGWYHPVPSTADSSHPLAGPTTEAPAAGLEETLSYRFAVQRATVGGQEGAYLIVDGEPKYFCSFEDRLFVVENRSTAEPRLEPMKDAFLADFLLTLSRFTSQIAQRFPPSWVSKLASPDRLVSLDPQINVALRYADDAVFVTINGHEIYSINRNNSTEVKRINDGQAVTGGEMTYAFIPAAGALFLDDELRPAFSGQEIRVLFQHLPSEIRSSAGLEVAASLGRIDSYRAVVVDDFERSLAGKASGQVSLVFDHDFRLDPERYRGHLVRGEGVWWAHIHLDSYLRNGFLVRIVRDSADGSIIDIGRILIEASARHRMAEYGWYLDAEELLTEKTFLVLKEAARNFILQHAANLRDAMDRAFSRTDVLAQAITPGWEGIYRQFDLTYIERKGKIVSYEGHRGLGDGLTYQCLDDFPEPSLSRSLFDLFLHTLGVHAGLSTAGLEQRQDRLLAEPVLGTGALGSALAPQAGLEEAESFDAAAGDTFASGLEGSAFTYTRTYVLGALGRSLQVAMADRETLTEMEGFFTRLFSVYMGESKTLREELAQAKVQITQQASGEVSISLKTPFRRVEAVVDSQGTIRFSIWIDWNALAAGNRGESDQLGMGKYYTKRADAPFAAWRTGRYAAEKIAQWLRAPFDAAQELDSEKVDQVVFREGMQATVASTPLVRVVLDPSVVEPPAGYRYSPKSPVFVKFKSGRPKLGWTHEISPARWDEEGLHFLVAGFQSEVLIEEVFGFQDQDAATPTTWDLRNSELRIQHSDPVPVAVERPALQSVPSGWDSDLAGSVVAAPLTRASFTSFRLKLADGNFQEAFTPVLSVGSAFIPDGKSELDFTADVGWLSFFQGLKRSEMEAHSGIQLIGPHAIPFNEQMRRFQFWDQKSVIRSFLRAAWLAKKLGFETVDINMCSPSYDSRHFGGGAALMENQPLAVAIIQALTQQHGLKGLEVSAKIMLFPQRENPNSPDVVRTAQFARALQDAGLQRLNLQAQVIDDWIEAFPVAARELADSLTIPVTYNGRVVALREEDIDRETKPSVYSVEGLRQFFAGSRVDKVMVGRALMGPASAFFGNTSTDLEVLDELMAQVAYLLDENFGMGQIGLVSLKLGLLPYLGYLSPSLRDSLAPAIEGAGSTHEVTTLLEKSQIKVARERGQKLVVFAGKELPQHAEGIVVLDAGLLKDPMWEAAVYQLESDTSWLLYNRVVIWGEPSFETRLRYARYRDQLEAIVQNLRDLNPDLKRVTFLGPAGNAGFLQPAIVQLGLDFVPMKPSEFAFLIGFGIPTNQAEAFAAGMEEESVFGSQL